MSLPCLSFLVSAGARSGRDQPQTHKSWPEREQHGHRQDQEDHRDHHHDLLRAPDSISARRPASRTSAACACITSVSGVPRSSATATASANRATPGDRCGTPGRRARATRACRCGRRPAPGPAQLTSSPWDRVDHPVQRGHRPLPCCHGQREQLGDRRELREHPALPLLHLARSAGSHARAPPATKATQQSTRSGTAVRGPGARRAAARPRRRENATSPQTTCSTRKSWTLMERFARSRRRRTDAVPPRTRSSPRPPTAGGARTRLGGDPAGRTGAPGRACPRAGGRAGRAAHEPPAGAAQGRRPGRRPSPDPGRPSAPSTAPQTDRSRQDPPLLRQPPDADHQPVGDDAAHPADASTTTPAGEA